MKRKLRACTHQNVNAYRYIRDDGAVEDKTSRTYMEFCLDCGSTRRYRYVWEPEPWLAPWLWRA